MKEAAWIQEYDHRTDSIYYHPGCPDCDMPIFDYDKCVCYGCGEELRLSPTMIEWHRQREGTKEETGKCMSCGKETMKIVYRKNPVTKEWQAGNGTCNACGVRFIV